MIDAFRSEWIKLRTVRVTWVLGIIAAVFPIVVATLSAMFESEPTTITDRDVSDVVTGTSIVTAMLLGVVAAISVTSEFSFGTIRPTFAALPDRTRVLLAKPALLTAVAAAVMTAVLTIAWLGATLIVDRRIGDDVRTSGEGTVSAAFVGCVLLGIGLVLLGYGLGLLIRNSAATASILLLWPLIAEGIVGNLLVLAFGDGSRRFLPYFAGFNMAVTETDDEAWGRVASGAYFGLWVVAIATLGVITTKRRDA